MNALKRLVTATLAVAIVLGFGSAANAFCGFYVGKADADLFNEASQVILARDADRTVITMANDYQGDLDEFAMVIPVPTVLEEGQINVGDSSIIDRLDAFTAPRLVEYFDPDPCEARWDYRDRAVLESAEVPLPQAARSSADNALGVTVEAEYSIGEYDIQILSATESNGLETWLTQNGYRIPENASPLLQPYIRQGMKFFVAKVNLEAFDRTGAEFLRPLQIAYESSKFMLPIRLGMTNANGDQDLIVYALSPRGQVELTNYRTVQIPSNETIPVFVESEFDQFYTSLFETAHAKDEAVVFQEYAWDIRSCDPCSTTPPSAEELLKAGVFWVSPNESPDAFVTRLHIRYNRSTFPEDLIFQETSNRQNFQGRYILQHPFEGSANCPAGRDYTAGLPGRFEAEAQTLARLTGWDIADIRAKLPDIIPMEPANWWEQLW
ncbi:MAG: DUF2330 domain-containing protein [Synechococcus sp.]